MTPHSVPTPLDIQFLYGTRREPLQGLLDPQRAQELLQGLCGLLEVCAYAPAETSVGEFLARVLAQEEGAQYGLFLAVEGDTVVGFLQARCLFEDAEIDYVAVSPSHRSRGIATRLVEAFESESLALGASRLLLEVGERNIVARALYASQGYEIMARRENYYQGREAALVLEKTL
ncbi:MAG: GNAT family N-acetyltransferase [Silvanigrellales bacterium]|jgi:ribosomal protein S18 acetylase RimI-like enzyme|nr:GNAT family N-acetyltransferase [Silvanigrellales bacterium]